jgi:hypothetical protein
MIDSEFLHARHGLSHGSKLLLSSEGNNGCPKTAAATAVAVVAVADGASASYPLIPCIDRTINAQTLVRHSGTRTYLSKLSPSKHKRLLFGTGETNHGGVLSGTGDNGLGENYFLADGELLILLFLQLREFGGALMAHMGMGKDPMEGGGGSLLLIINQS